MAVCVIEDFGNVCRERMRRIESNTKPLKSMKRGKKEEMGRARRKGKGDMKLARVRRKEEDKRNRKKK